MLNFQNDLKKLEGCSAVGKKDFRKRKLPLIKARETLELREKIWLPAFHLFGFSTELAFTFQLSSFQLQLTAHNTNHSRAKNHPRHHPSNALRIVSYLGLISPPVSCTNSCIFWKNIFTLSRKAYPAQLSRKLSWSHDTKALTVAYHMISQKVYHKIFWK